MSARVALSSSSSTSLLVAFLISLLSFPAFAQLSNNRLSFSPPSAHSSGTALSASPSPFLILLFDSPSPFQGRGGREGGVVTVSSRDTITQHKNSNKKEINNMYINKRLSLSLFSLVSSACSWSDHKDSEGYEKFGWWTSRGYRIKPARNKKRGNPRTLTRGMQMSLT